jgi:hypothetical protein
VRIAALAAALAVLLPLAACGGGDDGGKVVEGTGFEVTVPEDWQDRTDDGEDFEVEGVGPDLVLIGERDDGFTSNVNVVRTPGAQAGLDAQVRAEREALAAGRLPGSEEPNPARDLTPVERTTVDGEGARAYELGLRQGDRIVRLRQVLAQHDRTNYAITLTTAEGRFHEDRDALESILESWRWR